MSNNVAIRAIIITAIALSAVAVSCVRDKDAGGKVRDDLPLNQLRDGDLVFRSGVSIESHAVMDMDKNQGKYSHIGIAINDGGKWCVVHAVPGENVDGVDRVKIEPIDTFFLTTRAMHGAIMRPNQCDMQQAKQAARAAKACLGVEFDDRYDWNDSTRLYCTELVQRAYESVGVNLRGNRVTHVSLPFFKGDIVFPSDIQHNDSLTTIFSF